VKLSSWVGGGIVIGGFVAALTQVLASLPALQATKPPLSNPAVNDVAAVGELLFLKYNLPFQIIGVLLLVATIGVVVLSRKELK